jgi:pyruvate carboxylase
MVKVTPSSKVVGDMAMYMTANSLKVNDLIEKGNEIAFPDSMISLMKGELGQRKEGWPEVFQRNVLKNEKPFTDRPNAHLEPLNLKNEFISFQAKFPEKSSFLDFLSFALYPKVFEDYYQHLLQFGNTSNLPTPCFFYGLSQGDEIEVTIAKGKNILIEYLNTNEPGPDGTRLVIFRINGDIRSVMVKDVSAKNEIPIHKKANGASQIGSPLQGSLSKIIVKEGDIVKKNDPLFVIEAMKMESTITAPYDGKVEKVHLQNKTLVQQDDLIVELTEDK